MTAQEILLLDSSITVQVGAAQLQKILRTLKTYKELAEKQSFILLEKDQEIGELLQELQNIRNTSVMVRSISTIDLESL